VCSGGWISTDPAGLIDGRNLYVALKANPVKFIDVDGYASNDPALSVDRELGVLKELESAGAAAEKPLEKGEIKGALQAVDDALAARATLQAEREVALAVAVDREGQNIRAPEVAANVDTALDTVMRLEESHAAFDAELAIREAHVVEPRQAAAENAVEARALMTPEDMALAEAGRRTPGRTLARLRALFGGAALGLEVSGNLLGSAMGGYQVGTGINQMIEGKTEEGAVTVTEGSANLGLTIGSTAAVKGGLVTTTAGGAGAAATAGAGILAAGGIMLAAEEARRSLRGEKTAAVEATEFYADLAVEGEEQGGVRGAFKQAAGWTGGLFSTLITVGQGN
jgi:hypothetical protein